MSDEAPLAEPRRRVLAAVLGLAAVAVLVAFTTARRLESTRMKLEFEREANERVRAVRAEVESYINDLYAISALFRSSNLVTRAEFREFTHPLHARHRGLRAFDWVPRVPGAVREAYERQTGAEVA